MSGELIENFARWLESGGGDNSAFALNQSICCSGQDCGCRGSSVGEYLAYEFREFAKTTMARTLSDPQRLLWRDDVEGICPTPGACWEYGETARCGPCAIKQAAQHGVESNLSLPNLPEVSRLRRENEALRAELSALRGEGWQSIESAPRDGTEFQARIPGDGEDNVIAWVGDLLDSRGEYCGAWVFTRDQEPPDDWTDGYCWEVNEDGNRSTEPTHWKPLPTPDAAVIARLVGAYEAAVAFIESHAADPDLTDQMVRTYAEYQRTRGEYLTAAQRQSVSPQGDPRGLKSGG